jgi:hypothetical protein
MVRDRKEEQDTKESGRENALQDRREHGRGKWKDWREQGKKKKEKRKRWKNIDA